LSPEISKTVPKTLKREPLFIDEALQAVSSDAGFCVEVNSRLCKTHIVRLRGNIPGYTEIDWIEQFINISLLLLQPPLLLPLPTHAPQSND
jgi:hypothetical protein